MMDVYPSMERVSGIAPSLFGKLGGKAISFFMGRREGDNAMEDQSLACCDDRRYSVVVLDRKCSSHYGFLLVVL